MAHAASAPATVTITVYSVPVANADAYTAIRGQTLAVNAATGVLANDTNADGQALSAVLAGTPTNGSLTFNADGSFSYTPNSGFSARTASPTPPRMGIATSAPATVTITVYSVPVANADAYTVDPGTAR